MKVNKVFCFFEQSGTFKNVLKELGYNAYDVDIVNAVAVDYNIDLFNHIELAYDGYESIFDIIASNDLIIAFFPCIRFTPRMNPMYKMRRGLNDIAMLNRNIRFMAETNNLYSLFCKLFIVCAKRGLRLIVENPYRVDSFLNRYFAFEPKYIDYNRALHGDSFEKPTQYFFYNFEPCDLLFFSCVENVPLKKVEKLSSKQRSLISKNYAYWFLVNVVGLEFKCNNG